MVQTPKRNLSISTASSSTEASPLVEAPTVTSKKKSIKLCQQDQVKNNEVSSATIAPESDSSDVTGSRKPWGRSRSFDEPTERIPIALPMTLTQALRLKAVMVKKTPSQIIADLLRAHL